MNWPRYKFSKESEPELLEFFKAVAGQSSSFTTSSKDTKLWKELFPMNEEIQLKINFIKTTVVTNEIIDITNSDDENVESKGAANESMHIAEEFLLPDQSFTQLKVNESRLNTTTMEDLIDGVQELLESEPILSEDVIKQFGSGCSRQRLQEMFTLFATDLNSDCTLKLWKSINAAKCVERNIVASYFSQYILVQKILKEQDNTIKILLSELFGEFSNEIIEILQKILLQTNNTDISVLRSNLSSLPDEYKNSLLRIFIEHCTKLESHHLLTVQSLLVPHTDVQNLKRLVELMTKISKDFVSDKIYGKLLLEVIQILGSNAIQSEQELKYIVSIHKSVFKTQIIKMFEGCLLEQKMLSQSSSSFRI